MEPNGEQPKQQEISLFIKMGANGEISVTGPINNFGLCYQLLTLGEKAIDDLRNDAREAGKKRILPMPGLVDAALTEKLRREGGL